MRSKLLLTTLTALLLSGCGFSLVGSRPLPEPLRSVYIDSAMAYRVSEPPVETALRAALRRRGAEVRDAAEGAATVIRLSDFGDRREVLSLGLDGKAIEYQLINSVRYEVMANGRALVMPDVLSASRDYSFQPQQVLAKEAEEQRLREFIQSELAELIMLRLEAQLSRPAAAVPAAPAGAAPAAP
ncbi:MAG TPA: LPS assembly lipoprotein LptE [Solimonas sp.]|nr:LPS assembly lipoprotein LptE [Solimonas sp.]